MFARPGRHLSLSSSKIAVTPSNEGVGHVPPSRAWSLSRGRLTLGRLSEEERTMELPHDRAAIVTGGATIIGAAVVRAFERAGYGVVVADIDEEGGQRVADELGDRVRFVRTDVT